MTAHAYQIVLLQLFWLSFFPIGLAALQALQRVLPGFAGKFQRYFRQAPLLAAAWISFAVGVALYLPLVVVMFGLGLPVAVLAAAYLLGVLASLGLLARQWRPLVRALRRRRPASVPAAVLVAVAVGSLVVDYAFSLHAGATLSSDAPVHIARINYLLSRHFSLTDPALGNHGLLDARYSISFLGSLAAAAAKLLGLTALQVWWYSGAFYRLLIWLGMFTLVWEVLSEPVKRRWSLIVLAFTPFLLGYYFGNAEFPDRIVLAWAALFIVGISLWYETGSAVLLLLAAALIAAEHALYALMALGFLGLVMAGLLLFRLAPRRWGRAVWPAAALLAVPVALNLALPNRTALSHQAFNAAPISGLPLVLHHYGRWIVAALPRPYLFYWWDYVLVLVVLIVLAPRLKPKLRLGVYGLALVNLIGSYFSAVAGYLGMAYLAIQARSRGLRLIVVALWLYYALVGYDPLVLTLAAHRVPPWVISRFQEFNLLILVAPLLYVLAIFELPLRRWGYPRWAAWSNLVAVAVFALFLPFWNSVNLRLPARPTSDAPTLAEMQDVQQLAPELRNQLVFSNSPQLSFLVPALTSANVFNTLVYNYSPMANIPLRQACTARLARSLQLADLRAVGATRVIIANLPASARFMRLAASKPYLALQRRSGEIWLYRVLPGAAAGTAPAHDVCAIPYGE